MKTVVGVSLLWFLVCLLAGCDSHGGSGDSVDAGFDAGEASCIVEAGPDADPLMTCSPTGCFPFDNSVVPNVPRLE
ncbi:MAG TPA: hypothetical protein VK841_10295 [Polyangiaceae bacterium]|nr:hypothetical protein [Polyangiaceae bacterium]